VYPSLEIREGFGTYRVRTRGGQTWIGMLDSETSDAVVLRDLAGQKTRLRRSDVEEMEASPVSVMPEGLLKALNPQQIRDLFAYLMLPAKSAQDGR
jgi:putative heme-binding domain-containing protein